MSKQLTIGLFGFGVVGEGIYQVLNDHGSLNATIKKICIKHPAKRRDAPAALFTTQAAEILNDAEINLVVELIDDADDAFMIVSTALRKGKAVVSANKKMIATHLKELLQLQTEYNAPFLYEAAVCGSIPIVRNLEEYYDNDLLKSICGIVNGSTNYILTKIMEEGMGYEDALLQAQQLGFAESNPSLDVEGIDAANKLTILLLHAYGIVARTSDLLFKGITQIDACDARIAKERGYKIKLIAQAVKLNNGKIAAYVLPQFVQSTSQLYAISNEFNGMVITSKLADKQFISGKGAGRFPTSSAVLSDIAALRYDYKYEYRKLHSGINYALTNDFYLRLFISFNDWADINKNDFDCIEEYFGSQERLYIIVVMHYGKLVAADWLRAKSVSVVLMPEGIVEKEALERKRLKKVSLALAGVIC